MRIIKIILLALCVNYFSVYVIAQSTNVLGEWSGKIATTKGIQYVNLHLVNYNKNSYTGFVYDSNAYDRSFCKSTIEARFVNASQNKLLVEGKKMLAKYNTANSKHELFLLLLNVAANTDTIIATIAGAGEYISLFVATVANTIHLERKTWKEFVLQNTPTEIDRTHKNGIATKYLVSLPQSDKKAKVWYLSIRDTDQEDGDAVSVLFNRDTLFFNTPITNLKKQIQIHLQPTENVIRVVGTNEGSMPHATVTIAIGTQDSIYVQQSIGLKQGEVKNILLKDSLGF